MERRGGVAGELGGVFVLCAVRSLGLVRGRTLLAGFAGRADAAFGARLARVVKRTRVFRHAHRADCGAGFVQCAHALLFDFSSQSHRQGGHTMTDFSYQSEQVWVVIPTLNEAGTIDRVVRDCLPYGAVVLVIDGDSTDGTPAIARAAGARVETLRKRGKGRALRYALELVEAPVTVFIDADGSHVADDIPRLVAPILEGRAEMAVGCRWTGGSDELHGDMNKWLRRAGSRVLTTLVNLRWRADLTDIQNGFRALDTRVGRRIGLNQDDFTTEQEMIMKFLAGGFRVINVPSHEFARQAGEAKLDLGRVWFRFGIVVLRHLFNFDRPRLRARRHTK